MNGWIVFNEKAQFCCSETEKKATANKYKKQDFVHKNE